MKNKNVQIAPSILSADFARLGEEILSIEKAGADYVHVDVMDGMFVPNITIGPVVIKGVKKASTIPLDVHLMINEPIRYIDDFRKAGSDWITVHCEACDDIDATIEKIRQSGAKTGVSLKPGTELDEELMRVIKTVDLVLIMSVEPGFGGQSFMPEVLDKMKSIRKGFDGIISIDGGINKQTAPFAIEAGADWLVAGTAVFGQSDRALAIKELRG